MIQSQNIECSSLIPNEFSLKIEVIKEKSEYSNKNFFLIFL